MTNYEKIKEMSITEIVGVLVRDEHYKNIADEEYCTKVCPFRKDVCPFDDELMPCGELSDEYIALAWLFNEAEQHG